MSVTIFFEARRNGPLSEAERKLVQANEATYSVDDRIESFHESGTGYNGESYSIETDSLEEGVVLRGSVKLPNGDNEQIAEDLWHFIEAISNLRRSLTDLEWDFSLDDVEIEWDNDRQSYVPK